MGRAIPRAVHRPLALASGPDPPRGCHARVRRRGAARPVPGPCHRAGWPAHRPVRRPRRHAGAGHRHRGRRALLPRVERQPRRHLPHLPSQRRGRGRCPPGPRGSPQRGRRLGDQARRQHDHADDARRALDHGHDGAGRRDRRERPGPRGERGPVAQRRRGPRGHRPHRGHPPGRRDAGHRALRRSAPRAPEAGRLRLGVQRRGHDQPGGRAGPSRPRGGLPDLRGRRSRRAAPADRRPGHRDRLPRLLGVQVLRPPRGRPLRPSRGAGRPPHATSCDPPSTGSRPVPATSRDTPGRAPPSSTSPMWAAGSGSGSPRSSRG